MNNDFTNCPLCGGGGAKILLTLSFSERLGLPETVELRLCDCCDFAYISPRDASGYEKYYASTNNDQLDGRMADAYEISLLEAARYQGQVNLLSQLIDQPGPLKVLDIGCGRAGLLRTLQERYPQHQYYGSDPHIKEEACNSTGITFNRSWKAISSKFDLIILSHVMEHILDLGEFSQVTKLLAQTGSLYVEVPDSSRYPDAPRREYLYYIDRLHCNHFTPESLRNILQKYGLTVKLSGTQDFQYKDGNPYPACYAIASFDGATMQKAVQSQPLRDALSRYFELETGKAKSWQRKLSSDKEIVVYGFGDNFFRAAMPGGPLAGYKIRAIVDLRWRELSQTDHAKKYHFMDLADAIKAYSSLPFIVTVSWGMESIVQSIAESGVKRVFDL
ncbi:MAG: class I SAM-dependent methyltransferase [Burkholderiales bacterium]